MSYTTQTNEQQHYFNCPATITTTIPHTTITHTIPHTTTTIPHTTLTTTIPHTTNTMPYTTQTNEQQHYFNCPFQLGMGSDDSPLDADYYIIDDLRHGDLLVVKNVFYRMCSLTIV